VVTKRILAMIAAGASLTDILANFAPPSTIRTPT
jgi:hypothetical protein